MRRGFSSYHPFFLLCYFIGAASLIMLDQHPIFLVIDVLLMGLLLLIQDRSQTFGRWASYMLVLSLLFFIINPLTNHRGTHILFYFRNNPIMLEAVVQGLLLSLTLFAIMLLFATFNNVIPSNKFLYLFSRWTPQWALLASLSLRFVPLFRRRLREIETVQKGKGLSVTQGHLKKRIQDGMQLVQILLTWSLEEAMQTADSMAARGYGIRTRSRYNPYFFTYKEKFMLVILILVWGINLMGWWLGDAVLSIVPVLETMRLEGREWFYLAMNVLFIGFPLLIEAREALLWHYLKRNI